MRCERFLHFVQELQHALADVAFTPYLAWLEQRGNFARTEDGFVAGLLLGQPDGRAARSPGRGTSRTLLCARRRSGGACSQRHRRRPPCAARPSRPHRRRRWRPRRGARPPERARSRGRAPAARSERARRRPRPGSAAGYTLLVATSADTWNATLPPQIQFHSGYQAHRMRKSV